MTPGRRVLWTTFTGGIAGVGAVALGTFFKIDGFNPHSGFWGTNFLNSMLYGMGNDVAALTTVCIVWFLYGAALAGLIEATILSLRSRRS
jgi:hypothetical protein